MSLSPDIEARLAELERRVAALEGRASESAPQLPGLPGLGGHEAAESLAPLAGSLPLIGKALLGLAAAYVLRSVTENHVLPAQLGVLAAVVYAAWWLLTSARTPPEQRLAVFVHALTGVLVLYPMLWETTVRFHVLPSWATAIVLALFAALSLAIAWRRESSEIAWITVLAALSTTSALIVGTHDMLPFTLALLVIAGAVEFSACRDHWLGVRWAAAFVTDLFILLMMYLVSRPGGLPEGYAALTATQVLVIQGVLLALYLSSTAVRTLVRGLHFTNFEIGQAIAAFLIVIGGTQRITGGVGPANFAVALFLLLGGVFCYLVAFEFLDRKTGHDRNFYTYAFFGLLLIFAGIRVLLPGVWRVSVWSALAVGATWAGAKANRNTLRLHGAAYLIFAGISSGLLAFSSAELLSLGSALEPVILIPLAAATLCCAAIMRLYGEEPPRGLQIAPGLVFAAILWWGVASLAHWALVHALPGVTPAITATAGTIVLTLLAYGLARASRRWPRPEFAWLVWPVMILGAYKLLALDFPQGETHTLSVSLLFYGGALVLLPRTLRKDARQ